MKKLALYGHELSPSSDAKRTPLHVTLEAGKRKVRPSQITMRQEAAMRGPHVKQHGEPDGKHPEQQMLGSVAGVAGI